MNKLKMERPLTRLKLIVALNVVLRRGVGHVGQPGDAGLAELLLSVAPQVFEKRDNAGDDEAADEDDEDAADVGEAEGGRGAVGGHLALAPTLLLLPPFFFQHVELTT